MIESILVNIGYGLIYGAISAGIGYFASGSIEAFDKIKFFKTVLIGLLIGAVVGISGVDLDESSKIIGNTIGLDYLAVKSGVMIAVTMLVNKLANLIWNRGTEVVSKIRSLSK